MTSEPGRVYLRGILPSYTLLLIPDVFLPDLSPGNRRRVNEDEHLFDTILSQGLDVSFRSLGIGMALQIEVFFPPFL